MCVNQEGQNETDIMNDNYSDGEKEKEAKQVNIHHDDRQFK